MVIDMDKSDLETAITRQYSSLPKQMHFENQFFWDENCKKNHASVLLTPAVLSGFCPAELLAVTSATLMWIMTTSEGCAVTNELYLLIPKGWKWRYILLHNVFLEEKKLFWNMLSSIKEENGNPLWLAHKNSLKNRPRERVGSRYFIEIK